MRPIFAAMVSLSLVGMSTTAHAHRDPIQDAWSARFPDGVVHDFGKVTPDQHKFTFRIVNTSSVPLRIDNFRTS